jgi:hypothetical protein
MMRMLSDLSRASTVCASGEYVTESAASGMVCSSFLTSKVPVSRFLDAMHTVLTTPRVPKVNQARLATRRTEELRMCRVASDVVYRVFVTSGQRQIGIF